MNLSVVTRLRPSVGPTRAAAVHDLSLALIVVGVVTSTLTFSWVIRHDVATNYFPEFSGLVVYVSDVLLLAGVVVWGAVRIAGRRAGPLRYGPLYVFIPLVVLTGLSALSTGWASDPVLAVTAAARRGLLLLVYLVLVNEFRRLAMPTALALVAVGILHAIVSVGQSISGGALGATALGELAPGALGYEQVGRPRAYGLGFNPNPIGVAIATSLVISVSLLATPGGSGRWRGVLLGIIVLTFPGIVSTGSRSAFLGMLLGVGLIAFLALRTHPDAMRRVRGMAFDVALLIITAAGLVLLVASSRSDVTRIGPSALGPEMLAEGFGLRSRDAGFSVSIIREHWLLGVGAGNYPIPLKEQIASDVHSPRITPVHNLSLLIPAELGVLGAGAWAALAVAPLIWLVTARRDQRRNPISVLWLGVLAVVVVESFFDFTPWATQDGRVLFMAAFGMWAGAVGYLSQNRYEDSDQVWGVHASMAHESRAIRAEEQADG